MGKTDDRAGGVDSHASHINGAAVTGREQGWNELGMRPRRTLAEAGLVRKKGADGRNRAGTVTAQENAESGVFNNCASVFAMIEKIVSLRAACPTCMMRFGTEFF